MRQRAICKNFPSLQQCVNRLHICITDFTSFLVQLEAVQKNKNKIDPYFTKGKSWFCHWWNKSGMVSHHFKINLKLERSVVQTYERVRHCCKDMGKSCIQATVLHLQPLMVRRKTYPVSDPLNGNCRQEIESDKNWWWYTCIIIAQYTQEWCNFHHPLPLIYKKYINCTELYLYSTYHYIQYSCLHTYNHSQ